MSKMSVEQKETTMKGEQVDRYPFVIVGGGVAAISCVERIALDCPNKTVLLLTASNVVKTVSNLQKIGRVMETFDILESHCSTLDRLPSVKVLTKKVVELNSKLKVVKTSDGQSFGYEKLCLATGGRPRKISDHPRVLVIRDTETVNNLMGRLKTARRIVVVGNGGIATEVVGGVRNLEVIWVVKHESISASFVDAGAAQFFLPYLNKELDDKDAPKKRLKSVHQGPSTSKRITSEMGSALGPDWMEGRQVSGSLSNRKVHIEYKCSVDSVISADEYATKRYTPEQLPQEFIADHNWPVYIVLSNQKVFGCDYIISAIGVQPNNSLWVSEVNEFCLGNDGGLLVNDQMETSVADVYAAGDVCTAGWKKAFHWFQMRLWSQARQMGTYAAQCMIANSIKKKMDLDICFDIFTHVTNFFGFKVVLLGCYNSQQLRKNHEQKIRISPGVEYVKVVLQDGRIHGCILIGETGLEEVIENLIMNGTYVENIKDDLLNPRLDIEDYFD